MDIVTLKLINYLDANNISQADLVKAGVISNGMVTQWKNESTAPSRKTLKKIADYFNLPISYFYETDNNHPSFLVGTEVATYEKKEGSATAEPLDETFRENGVTPKVMNSLTDSQKTLLINMIKEMTEK